MNIGDKTFLTKEEAAEYLGIKKRCLDKWTAEFGIPYSQVGRKRYFKRLDLDRFLESKKQGVFACDKPRRKRVAIPFPGEDFTKVRLPADVRERLGLRPTT